MQKSIVSLSLTIVGTAFMSACGSAGPVSSNVASANANASTNVRANTVATVNTNTNSNAAVTVSEAAEPNEYRANVTVKLEALGSQQKMAMPTLSAKVARSGNDRRMEFAMPAGGRIVYLDKAGTNYLILPDRNQYGELNRESLGFEVRRLLMPDQIVQQVKNVRGVERVGEEKYNGRDVIKYRYDAVADTKSQAGEVTTDSFLLVDKDTGLPLRSETVSQSQSGGSVQGYSGVRIITEISDIQTDPPATLFAEPTNMQKVESEQIRVQVDMIFKSLGAVLAEVFNQMQPAGRLTSTPAG